MPQEKMTLPTTRYYTVVVLMCPIVWERAAFSCPIDSDEEVDAPPDAKDKV